jgi:hypothetical protein
MEPDPDEEYSLGIISGGAWARLSVDREALELVELFDGYQDPSCAEALVLYMRCVDPEEDLTADEILVNLEAAGILTSLYLLGFIVGAQGEVRGRKRPVH